MSENPHLTTLLIIRAILRGTQTSESLQQTYGVSWRQLQRHIADARHLGAQLVSERLDGHHYWTCTNAATIARAGLLDRWIELEERRSLT